VGIIFRGLTDAYSWIDTGFGSLDQLLFDRKCRPYPACWGVMDALMER